MRRLLCVFTLMTGCADLYGLDDYTTRHAAPTSPTVEESTASHLAPGRGVVTRGSPAHCSTSAECNTLVSAREPVPSTCVKGTCQPLVSAACPRVVGAYTNDDAVLIGTILDDALERAAVLAAREIGTLPARAPGEPERPLVVVSCDASQGVLAAGAHLVDRLQVRAVVGPMEEEDVVELTQQIAVKSKTLLVTPASHASSLSNLADEGLTWRMVPSDAQRAGLLIAQMSALEDVLESTRGLTAIKLGVIHRTDTMGVSMREALSGKLVINGRFIDDAANVGYVSTDAYDRADAAAALSAIVTRYADSFRPDLVYLTAPEQIEGVLAPLERALAAARVVNRPYYMIAEPAKTQALLDTVAAPDMPVDLKRRIRGIAATSDTGSSGVRAGFEARFLAAYEAKPQQFAQGAAYDAMYAVAFAAAAAPKMTGPAVAAALRNLGVGAAVAVGPEEAPVAMSNLVQGKSVSLRGVNTLLRWDAKGDISGGTVEAFCIGTASGTPAFGSSGLTMDVETQVIGGAFVQCQ